jgi:hypothetical protein
MLSKLCVGSVLVQPTKNLATGWPRPKNGPSLEKPAISKGQQSLGNLPRDAQTFVNDLALKKSFVLIYCQKRPRNLSQYAGSHRKGLIKNSDRRVTTNLLMGHTMTSISAASNTFYSPLQRLQQELQSEVSGGTVSSGDQTALSSALIDIDSSLKSDASASQSASASPGDIQTKINDLISKEVSSGKLTSDQASELQNLFSKAFAEGSGGQGAGGPPPGSPPGSPPDGIASSQTDEGFSIADLVSSGSTPSTNSASSVDGSTSTDSSSAKISDVNNILKDFLKLLQDSQSSGATYGSSGSASTSLSALLVNYQT